MHFLSSPPLHTALLAVCASSTLCWLISLVTGNCSQVDRLWSIAPPLYVAWFAVQAGLRDPRLDGMALLTALWGARLTYNFARKGGYRRGSEDYRWPVLRKRLGPVLFPIFNVTFIATYQNLLLLLLALPAFAAYEHRGAPLGLLDGVAAVGFLFFLAGETVADQQQWRFQSDKHAHRARGEAVTAEFLTSGLFRWSRHPSFFCEQAMWWMVYLFSVAAGAGWLNASVAGAVLLTLLFQGSTAFTERLSLEKYPSYAEYQRTTSRLVPWPPRRR
jgi:steroid 5-alpha reductase family enzyme